MFFACGAIQTMPVMLKRLNIKAVLLQVWVASLVSSAPDQTLHSFNNRLQYLIFDCLVTLPKGP